MSWRFRVLEEIIANEGLRTNINWIHKFRYVLTNMKYYLYQYVTIDELNELTISGDVEPFVQLRIEVEVEPHFHIFIRALWHILHDAYVQEPKADFGVRD